MYKSFSTPLFSFLSHHKFHVVTLPLDKSCIRNQHKRKELTGSLLIVRLGSWLPIQDDLPVIVCSRVETQPLTLETLKTTKRGYSKGDFNRKQKYRAGWNIVQAKGIEPEQSPAKNIQHPRGDVNQLPAQLLQSTIVSSSGFNRTSSHRFL